MKKYDKTSWIDDQTLVSADNLNKVEDQLELLTNNSITFNSQLQNNIRLGYEETLFNNMKDRFESRYVNVKDFGAKGDGITDDNKAIQAAMDYCIANNKQLLFDNKTYLCYSISVPPGIKINGNGAILKKPNLKNHPYNMTVEQMKWIRMFTISYTNNDHDSPNTLLENLNFDGNCYEMWSVDDGYSQEQASLIIAFADNAKPGRLNLSISNCSFVNNVSDGIHIHRNVKANIINCRSKDCFRGGFVTTGGNNTINVDNFIFESVNTSDGIDVEIDAPGYGGKWASQITFNNIIIDKDLDVVAGRDSKVIINNLIMNKGFFYLGSSSGELIITNSTLKSTNKLECRAFIEGTGKITCSNVKFEGINPNNNEACLPIQFLRALEGSSINVHTCSFYNAKYAIGGGLGSNTNVFIKGCYFDSSITDIAIGSSMSGVAFAPKQLHISDCIFNNPGKYLQCLSVFSPNTEIYISNISVTNPENTGIYVHHPTLVYNVVLINGYNTQYSTGANPKVFGRRLLIVEEDPNTLNLRGYKNVDIAILKTDKTKRWEYSYQNAGSPWNHVWNEI